MYEARPALENVNSDSASDEIVRCNRVEVDIDAISNAGRVSSKLHLLACAAAEQSSIGGFQEPHECSPTVISPMGYPGET